MNNRKHIPKIRKEHIKIIQQKYKDIQVKSREEELKKYFEIIRQKNQEAQAKLTITISWAASAFILGMFIDKIKYFSSCEKSLVKAMFITFTVSLMMEFLAEIFLEKAAEYDKSGNVIGDYFDFLGRGTIIIRNFLFFIGMILLITIPSIIINN